MRDELIPYILVFSICIFVFFIKIDFKICRPKVKIDIIKKIILGFICGYISTLISYFVSHFFIEYDLNFYIKFINNYLNLIFLLVIPFPLYGWILGIIMSITNIIISNNISYKNMK